RHARPGRGRACSLPVSRRRDSNPRPSAYKALALPTELLRRADMVGKSPCCLFWTRPSRCVRHGACVEHPKDVGDRTTLAVMAALRGSGFALYMPFGENTRCDLVVDDGQRLARVQCKTGRLRQGAVRFAVCSHY